MINGQFALSLNDMTKFKELKDSVTYRSYIQEIVKSPVYKQVAQEHIDNVDVSEDIAKIKDKIELSPQVLSKIYKGAISKMAVSIIADTIILKELSELRLENAKTSMEDVKTDMDEGFLEIFLMGFAPKEYYTKAEQRLKAKPDSNSVLYKGLIEFKKRNNTQDQVLDNFESEKPKRIKKKVEPNDIGIDISTDSIDLG